MDEVKYFSKINFGYYSVYKETTVGSVCDVLLIASCDEEKDAKLISESLNLLITVENILDNISSAYS